MCFVFFFFSSRRRHTRLTCDWSSDVCSSDLSGEYRLVVLDEVTYPINWGWIDGEAVAAAVAARPLQVSVIATGRAAPPALIEIADTVTEMVKVKHAYDRGIRARRGIDF